MKFYCIADEETVRAFRLAGVAGEVAPSGPALATTVEQAVVRPDCGILVLTESVAAGIRPLVDAVRLGRDHPLIVEIPGPEGPLRGRKSLRQFVQEAIGIHVG